MGGGGPPAASPGAVLVNGAGQALAAGTASSGSTIAGYGDGFSTLNVQDNKAKGDAWESEKADAARSDYPQVGQQITIKTSDGTRSRVDIMTRDNQGTIGCIECKASDDAPLTKNQAIAFPLLESQGAVIVGKGKPGFEGGTVIPPTKVQIVRPPSNGAGK
jgi:filamentous hemagglutinin